MPKAPLFSVSGEAVGDIDLPDAIFAIEPNEGLLHEAVIIQQGNARQGTAQGKTRGMVAGSKRKPWKQKGTGRARSGRVTSPLWRRGGKSFPPEPRSYARGINRKAKRLALLSALTLRASVGGVVVFEDLSPETPRTGAFAQVLRRANLEGRRALLLVDEVSHNLRLASRNLPLVDMQRVLDVSVLEVVRSESLVFTRASLDALLARNNA